MMEELLLEDMEMDQLNYGKINYLIEIFDIVFLKKVNNFIHLLNLLMFKYNSKLSFFLLFLNYLFDIFFKRFKFFFIYFVFFKVL